MSPHRSSIQDTAVPPPVTTTRHTDPESERARTPAITTDSGPVATQRGQSRWPMRVVVAVSLFVGLAAAVVGVVVSAGGTEPVIDAFVLLGFAAGWSLLLADRSSSAQSGPSRPWRRGPAWTVARPLG